MEGEHTPTIILLILSTDLTLIQPKDSLKFFVFPIDNEGSDQAEAGGGGRRCFLFQIYYMY